MGEDFCNAIVQTNFEDVNKKDLQLLRWLHLQGFLSPKGAVFLSKVELDIIVKEHIDKKQQEKEKRK